MKRLSLLILLLVSLNACVPFLMPPSPSLPNTPHAQELQRLAEVVWHKMQIYYLSEGRYSSNVLVDVSIPQGSKVELQDIGSNYFLVRLSSSRLPQYFWNIQATGVTLEGTQAYPLRF